MKISDLKQQTKIAILGFGVEGKSSLSFLLSIGIKPEYITILDQNTIKSTDLHGFHINYGDTYLDYLCEYDVIIKTPGISPYHEKIFPYINKLLSQTEIFLNNYEGKVIGITGTKGKSTTVSITYQTLNNAGYKVKLVGNIGTPVLSEISLDDSNKYDYIVYELSSYMLENVRPKLFIGVLGNIFRCHVDWHNNDYEVYKKSKLNILKNSEYGFTNINLKEVVEEQGLDIQKISYFGKLGQYSYKDKKFFINETEVLQDENITLKGEHNRINITSIIAILDRVSQYEKKDIKHFIASLKEVLSSFQTLPHRLEEVGKYKGILFIDDSISTTPDSTVEAIKTYEGKIGTIFLGGFNYGFEFEEFAQQIKKYNIKNIVFFPDTGKDIKREIDKIGYEYNAIETNSMKEAIDFAYKNCINGEIVLLSCASPSFSMYNNYKERGNDFKEKAKLYTK